MIIMEDSERMSKAQELDKLQEEVNKLYELYGLTDEVLDKQIEINKLRNELDIPDETEIINDEGFVQ